MKSICLSACVILFAIAAAAQQNVTTTGGTTNTIPKFSSSTNIVNSALSESSGNLTIGTNSYLGGFSNPTTMADGGYVDFTGACCSIDSTHSGYGAWLNYNAFFNGSNFIQPRGDLNSYLFTSNFHAGGWGWFTHTATGSSGSAFTPVKVASLDGSGNFGVSGNLTLGTNRYLGGFTDPTSLGDGGYVNFTGMCCSIDATHSGYGTWVNYNGYFNGSNWIQPRGDLNTYMFTSNFHAGGWGWFSATPTGTNGSAITPVEVASINGSGHLKLAGGIDAAGSGIKHARAGGCNAGSNLSCSVTVSWPGSAFADTNYTAVCTPDNIGSSGFSITNKTTTSVTVTTFSLNVQVVGSSGGTGPPISMGGVECMAMHD